MTQLYRAPEADEMIRQELDSMTLIFHRKSGITHMVSDPVPAILDIMGNKPLSADDIASAIEASFELEDNSDVLNVVHARLDELCELGLVEKVAG